MSSVLNKSDDKNLEIVNGPVLKTFFKFTLPNVIGFIAMSSTAIVDGIFVGNYVGEAALAAVNIVIPVITLVFGVAIMFSIGGAVRVGKYLGEGNFTKASELFTNIHVTIGAIAVFMSAVCLLFGDQVVRALGANKEMMPYALTYLRVSGMFFLFQAFEYSLAVFVRIDGNPYLASFAVILGALVNLISDYILIVKLDVGIGGAAFSSGIAFVLSTASLSLHFLLKKGNLHPHFKKYDLKEIRSSAYNGSSELLSEVSSGVIAFLFNWVMIKSIGTKGVAAFTVINYTIWTVNMISYSIGDSLVPLISVNYGAKRNDRIRKFLKIGVSCVIFMGIAVFLVMAFIPEKLVGLFLTGKDKEAYEIALVFASYIKWAFLFSGSSIIISAYFTAIHRPLQSVLIAGSRGLWFPVLFLAVLPLFAGVYGIYAAVPVSEIVTIMLGIFLYKYSRKKIPSLK